MIVDILKIAGFIVCCAFFFIAIDIGFSREEKRKEVVRKYNCEHFGAAINKFAKEEICPPTPKG